MPETDSPLKDLLREFAPDFAAWLLNVDRADIRDIHQETIELPAGQVFSDTVFHVTLANEQRPVLHVEFQGERSERPMRWRMLDYMSRLAQHEEWDALCSAVIYVGERAGLRDTGDHRLRCPDGGVSLAWRYRVIRLWEMLAEEILALGRPALLPLIGQTRIAKPAETIPQVVTTIGRVEDFGQRARLFTALTGLMRDEEVMQMTERMIEAMGEGLLTDTPYLRRIREKSRVEGREEGRAEGRAEGRVEGRVEGQAQGLTAAILKVLATRLDFTIRTYNRLEQQLAAIHDVSRLQALLQTAVLTPDVASFERALEG